MEGPERQLYGMGLHRLMGTRALPAASHPSPITVKPCAENGMHGLKGGSMAQGRL
jgi:hypothetical protein